MGSLFGGGGSSGGQGLFGGQQQTSQSSSTNQAFPFLKGALTSNIGNIGAAGNQLASMLGLNGAPAQNAGFSNFNNSTGYQFGLNQGIQSIVGNAATNGLLNSGGTLKAIDTYGQNYANTQYGNYMNQLMGLLGAGNQSASVLGNAGNTFQSTSRFFRKSSWKRVWWRRCRCWNRESFG
jgi:hypothetical protein